MVKNTYRCKRLDKSEAWIAVIGARGRPGGLACLGKGFAGHDAGCAVNWDLIDQRLLWRQAFKYLSKISQAINLPDLHFALCQLATRRLQQVAVGSQ